jgi:AsmA protein
MRMLKWLAWSVAGVVALMALAIAWLLLWFDPNQYKPDIEKLVKDQTGRTLTLQGDLKLSFWPSLAVELGKTSLGNAPGYGDVPMLSVDQVRLGVKVWPLLHKQVQVGAIELDALAASLTKRSETENNWSDLGKQSNAGETAAAPTSNNDNFNVSIERVDIRNASISYDDQAARQQSTLSKFNLTTGKLEAGKPVALESSFVLEKTAADNSKQTLDAKFKTQIDADTEAQRYALIKPTVDLNLKHTSGKTIPVSISAEAIRADLQVQTAEITKLLVSSGDLKLSGDITGTQIKDAPALSGTLALSPVSLRLLAKQFDIELPVTRDTKVLQQFSLQSAFSASSKSAEFKSMVMKLDDTTLKGNVAVTDFERKSLRFDLALDRIDVDRYLAPVAETPQQKQSTDTGPVKIPGEMVRGLDIVGQLRMGQATISKVLLSDVTLGLDARNDKLRLSPVSAKVYEGQFKGDVLFDATGKVPQVALNEQVSGVNFAPLFKALYQTERISGRGNVNLKLAGSGADSDALKRTLSGTVNFKVDDGAYEGVDLWWEIRRARALLRQQTVPNKPTQPRTAFTALSGSGVMTNGVFTNKDLNAALQYLKVTGQGSADLVKSSIDYQLQAAVLKFPSEAKLASGAQDNGEDLVGLTIPITITGALTDPKVRPDVAGLLKARAQQEIDKQKEKAQEKLQQEIDKNKDKLKDQLQDKLKGLFGR